MIKEDCENVSALLINFDLYKKKSNLSLDKNLKWGGGGGYHYEMHVFLKYTLDSYWYP